MRMQLPRGPSDSRGQWEKRDDLPQQVSGVGETDEFRKRFLVKKNVSPGHLPRIGHTWSVWCYVARNPTFSLSDPLNSNRASGLTWARRYSAVLGPP